MSIPSPAILSNFFEKQWTQNHPQYLSGLSRALYLTTFLEIAVYERDIWKTRLYFEVKWSNYLFAAFVDNKEECKHVAYSKNSQGPKGVLWMRYWSTANIRVLEQKITLKFPTDWSHIRDKPQEFSSRLEVQKETSWPMLRWNHRGIVQENKISKFRSRINRNYPFLWEVKINRTYKLDSIVTCVTLEKAFSDMVRTVCLVQFNTLLSLVTIWSFPSNYPVNRRPPKVCFTKYPVFERQ